MFVRTPRRGKLVFAYDYDGRLIAPSYIRGLGDGEPFRHIAEFQAFRSWLSLKHFPASHVDDGFLARYALGVQQTLSDDPVETRQEKRKNSGCDGRSWAVVQLHE